MKKLFLTAVLLVSCLMFKADAQLRISLGFNIGSQPDWGPVGYDHASYYYMPDVDAYYDVSNHQYVYMQNNAWVRGTVLPGRYNFDPYNSYKVVVNERNPWERASVYRTKYKVYKGRRDQQIIRNSRDTKYRNHWQGNNGRGNGRDDRGNNGRGNGHDDHGNNGRGNGHDDKGRGHDNH